MGEDLVAIMAAYNASATIRPAIDSILAMKSPFSVRVVVVDDGSTDDTAQIVRDMDSDKVTLISVGENVGRAEARNVAIRSSNSNYFMICDADDLCLPHRARIHYAHLVEKMVDVSSGQLIDLHADGSTGVPEYVFPSDEMAIHAAFKHGRMPIANPASAFTREVYERTGGYDPALKWCEDYDFYLRASSFDFHFEQASEALIEYRRRTRVTALNYWISNHRYHAAIWMRFEDGNDLPRMPIGPYLRRASSPGRAATVFVRYCLYRLRVLLRRFGSLSSSSR